MRAAIFQGQGSIEVHDVADPAISDPRDAIVQVTHSCICGSDLWPYRGFEDPGVGSRCGHEMIGLVAEVGSEVTTLRKGDRVINPFMWSCGTCAMCRQGVTTSCLTGGFFSSPGTDGCQGQAVRIPTADGTLVKVAPDLEGDDAALTRLLPLSDVMATGHHAAVSAGVTRGGTAVVIGDGAVGLCGVLAAARLGAERIIALGHHADRLALAQRFGATDVVTSRGDEAVAAVLELTDGLGAPAVLECVGNQAAMDTAVRAARPGGRVGFVGVPADVQAVPISVMFDRNVGVCGGVAPARAYLPELLADVLAGTLDASPVFDLEVSLEDIASGYTAMDERRATKVLVRP